MAESLTSSCEIARRLAGAAKRRWPLMDYDDLLSYALETAMVEGPRFDPSRHPDFEAWLAQRIQWELLTRVRNSTWRAQTRERNTGYRYDLDGEALSSFADPSADPVDIVARRETIGKIFDALRRVPERHRRIFLAREIQGRGLKEIALEEGVAPHRIANILHLTRRRVAAYATRL